MCTCLCNAGRARQSSSAQRPKTQKRTQAQACRTGKVLRVRIANEPKTHGMTATATTTMMMAESGCCLGEGCVVMLLCWSRFLSLSLFYSLRNINDPKVFTTHFRFVILILVMSVCVCLYICTVVFLCLCCVYFFIFCWFIRYLLALSLFVVCTNVCLCSVCLSQS